MMSNPSKGEIPADFPELFAAGMFRVVSLPGQAAKRLPPFGKERGAV